MPNYGDVALGLTESWSRNQYENQELMMLAIGHENGVPDVFKTKEPEAEFQFVWVDPKDATEVTRARMRGYEFVTKSDWTKHAYLWQWDAQERIEYAGQNLMARPKERWLADQLRIKGLSERARKEDDREVDSLPNGLVPTTRAKRARAGV
jgi:hypothetical protein